MYADIAELLRRLGLWFLVNVPANADLAETIARYRAGVEALRGTFSSLVSPYEAQDTESAHRRTAESGRAARCGRRCGGAAADGRGAGDRAACAPAARSTIDLVAGAYFAIGAIVGIDRLRGLAARIIAPRALGPPRHPPHRRRSLRRAARADRAGAGRLRKRQDRRTRAEGLGGRRTPGREDHADALARTRSFLDELERARRSSIAKLTLANSQIHELAGL